MVVQIRHVLIIKSQSWRLTESKQTQLKVKGHSYSSVRQGMAHQTNLNQRQPSLNSLMAHWVYLNSVKGKINLRWRCAEATVEHWRNCTFLFFLMQIHGYYSYVAPTTFIVQTLLLHLTCLAIIPLCNVVSSACFVRQMVVLWCFFFYLLNTKVPNVFSPFWDIYWRPSLQ